MFRPVRQLRIKSLLFLVPLVAGMAAAFRNTESDLVLPKLIAILIWHIPPVLALWIRSRVILVVCSLAVFVAMIISLFVYAMLFGFGQVPETSLSYLLVNAAAGSILWIVIGFKLSFDAGLLAVVLTVVLYAALGPLFAMSCTLRNDSTAVTEETLENDG